MNIKTIFVGLFLIVISDRIYSANSFEPKGLQQIGASATDTIYADKILPSSSLLTNSHYQYTILIRSKENYSSIKLLDRDVKVNGNKVIVVQKLYDGKTTNIDSTIADKDFLKPKESYSDISTTRDSFIYSGHALSGTMQNKDNNKLGEVKKIDTVLTNTPFNSLMYFETYKALKYIKNHPFYLAEYVPGHGIVKFSKVEYIKDDVLDVTGVKIAAKVLKSSFQNITFYIWLNSKNQELLKIEGKFPRFDYYLKRII